MCAGDEKVFEFCPEVRRRPLGQDHDDLCQAMVDLWKKASAGPCKSRMVVAHLVNPLFLDISPVLRSTSIRVTVYNIDMYTQLFLF